MEKLNIKLPDKPGIYFFKKGKSILYIGKATSLKSRVSSYLSDDILLKRSVAIKRMVDEATAVDFEVTDSALDALILEAYLIKKHRPKYNTKEKDDKSFNYVVITKEDYPRIFTVRGKELSDLKNSVKYSFGPFPKGAELKEALRIVRKIFPFRDKKSKIPTTSSFNKQIGLEPKDISKKEYGKTVRNIKLFFEGKKTKLLKDLEKEMKAHAQNKEFEKAGQIRDKIFAIKHINDISLLKRDTISKYQSMHDFRVEAYDIAHMSGKNTVGVMTVVQNGEVDKNEYRKFKIKGDAKDRSDDTANLAEVLERRFKNKSWRKPDLLVIDGGIAQKNTAEKVLKQMKLNYPVVSVVKDERHKPKNIIGDSSVIKDYRNEILLANAEAHRFAIFYHKKLRDSI